MDTLLPGEFVKRQLLSIISILILVISGLSIILQFDGFFQSAEGVSTLTQESYDDFVNGTKDNIVVLLSGQKAELNLSHNVSLGWSELQPTIRPNATYGSPIANIYGTDKILLFYCQNKNQEKMNETWIYDVGNDTWLNKTSALSPPARKGTKLAPVWGTDKVVLFGGVIATNVYLDDTWVYDYGDNTWTEMNPISKPDKRVSFGFTHVKGEKRVLLFGGTSSLSEKNNDIWIYDLELDQWIPKTPLIKPPARMEPEIISNYLDDKIMLFGGQKDPSKPETRFNDTWVYDISDNQWVQKHHETKPTKRFRHSMTAIYGTDKIMLYGGTTDEKTVNETWIYDLTANTWTQKILEINPGTRHGSSITSVYNTNKIIIYSGGTLGFPFNNHTWVADTSVFYKPEGTYVSVPLAMINKSSVKTILWESNKPLGTTIKFQLRSAMTKEKLNSTYFYGPDGTIDSYYLASSDVVWPGHNGALWIQYKVYLSTLNDQVSPTLKNVTIKFNHWPETKLSSPINGSIISNNNPKFMWKYTDDDSSGQVSFQVLVSNNITFDEIIYDSTEQTSGNAYWQFPAGTGYDVIADGIWYWKVRTKDSDGDWSEYSAPWSMMIDTTGPKSHITYPLNNGFYDILTIINGTSYDLMNGSGISRVELNIQRLSDNYYWDGSEWLQNLTWLSTKGNLSWYYPADSIIWDSGIKYSIQAKAIDVVNNSEIYINRTNFTIDQDAPISNIDFPEKNNWLNRVALISGHSLDINGSGIRGTYILIKEKENRSYWNGFDWIPNNFWLKVTGANNWTFNSSDVGWKTDTDYEIYSRSTDNLNHTEIPHISTNFMFDNKPPEDLEITINNNSDYTINNSVELILHATDSGSGLYSMSFSFDNVDWTSWEPFKLKKSLFLVSRYGNVTIYFRVMDYAGNIAKAVYSTIEYLNDTDNDTVPDIFDAFPTDPAAAVDTDGDNYPNFWNPNKTAKDSTTGLALDEYPDDPDRHKKEPPVGFSWFSILLFIFVIILLLILAIVITISRKRKRIEVAEPFREEKILQEVIYEYLFDKENENLKKSSKELKNKAVESYESGDISEETFEFINSALLFSDSEGESSDKRGRRK